ncbi:Hypothetical predicted protein [Pelobates cultripes]|uniref:Uncharacterized protein n=1 Tax=Pelobates cultripes TaxID=61616 RepID=A0AAD1TPD2_PELCU|nr:Hypothetical predicted protein [Pelobates cultripes]
MQTPNCESGLFWSSYGGHIWWSCPIIQRFWDKITKFIKIITVVSLPFDPKTLIFGLIKGQTHKPTNTLVLYLLTAANLLIPQFWKRQTAPSIRKWILKVESFRVLEELNSFILHRYTLYRDIWDPWLKFLQTQTSENSPAGYDCKIRETDFPILAGNTTDSQLPYIPRLPSTPQADSLRYHACSTISTGDNRPHTEPKVALCNGHSRVSPPSC